MEIWGSVVMSIKRKIIYYMLCSTQCFHILNVFYVITILYAYSLWSVNEKS